MSKDLKKNTTTIHEYARLALGITRDEYALCSYVQYRCADSRSKQRGYCSDTKKDVAEFVGITKRGLLKMIERLEGLGLIERSAFGYLGVTPYWIDTDSEYKKNNKKGEQSSLSTVNKVHSKGEQSSLSMVNKVHSHNKVKEDIKEDKEDYYVERKVAEAADQFPEVGNMILQFEEKEKKNTPVPAAPSFLPAPANPALDQMEWLHEMDTDPRVAETMKMAHQVPASKKDEYLAAFTVQLSGTTQVHHSRKDLRNHFFNFCRARYRAEQKEKSETTPPGQSAYTAPVTKREVPAYVD